MAGGVVTALELAPTVSDIDDDPTHLACCLADRALCGVVLRGFMVPDTDPRPVCKACKAALSRGEAACVLGKCPNE